ncbi:transposase [Variovorax sp. YR566]|uniref:transposase n=1 Tax=Variovorax sp. YR566 TaxID=3450237 RepID=UPI003F7F5D7C
MPRVSSVFLKCCAQAGGRRSVARSPRGDGAGGATAGAAEGDQAVLCPSRPRSQALPLEAMLRVHPMQSWFALSDPAMEEALCEIASLRSFAGSRLGEPSVQRPAAQAAGAGTTARRSASQGRGQARQLQEKPEEAAGAGAGEFSLGASQVPGACKEVGSESR